MSEQAFQDQYPKDYANCYGCGWNNPDGMQLKSHWEGDESVCRYTPDSKYTGGYTGFVYGGLIASIMDCHGAGTAAAAKAKESGEPISRFVTASLKVDYLKPTPLGVVLEVRGKAVEVKGRKVTVDLTLSADSVVCATGTVIMVQVPELSK